VRLSASNKGSLVEHVLREMFGAVDSTNGLMVFCAGDDSTDEDMFRALNNYNAVHSPGAMYTVHVDGGSEGLRTTTQARFHVASPQQLVTFLSSLIDDK
jgi:trehalose 6-phosphate synthase/phosphatase